MELREFGLERYKGYAEPTQLRLAPLTILVGANNSGKTALARAIRLLAGGLAPSDQDTSEPLPLESGGIHHGLAFRDLVSGRAVHGWLRLSAIFTNSDRELSLKATVRNVESSNRPPQRQIAHWSLRHDAREVVLDRKGWEEQSSYDVLVSGSKKSPRQVAWRGLLPKQPGCLDDWVEPAADDLKAWTAGVRHLQCPRRFPESPLPVPEGSPVDIGPHGERATVALAADDALREAVSKWYRSAFGVAIDVLSLGDFFELRARSVDAGVRLAQSGPGTFTRAPRSPLRR